MMISNGLYFIYDELSTHLFVLALYQGVPIWRRGKEECLIYTVVCMHLISEEFQKMGYLGNVPCNGDVKPTNVIVQFHYGVPFDCCV